jgi:hypothetical protein
MDPTPFLVDVPLNGMSLQTTIIQITHFIFRLYALRAKDSWALGSPCLAREEPNSKYIFFLLIKILPASGNKTVGLPVIWTRENYWDI